MLFFSSCSPYVVSAKVKWVNKQQQARPFFLQHYDVVKSREMRRGTQGDTQNRRKSFSEHTMVCAT